MNEEDFQIRSTIPPDDYYQVVETELAKIHRFFSEKWETFRGNDGRFKWDKYLAELGLDHIISETYLADPVEYDAESVAKHWAKERPAVPALAPVIFDGLAVDVRTSKSGSLIENWRADAILEQSQRVSAKAV